PEAPKHKGISYLLVDMKSPGVSFRPVQELTGRSGFYETFFDNVSVPKENLLGRENEGWYVATTTLGLERSGITRIGAIRRSFDDVCAHVRSLPATGRPDEPAVTAAKLAEHYIEIEVGRWLSYRVAWMQDQGQQPNYEASVAKTFATELAQRLANTTVNLLGLPGTLALSSYGAPIDGFASFTYLLTAHWSISAGTSEIQRNIIAQRGLGLPRG
ncbi:MAG: acyl-CoA dehydrogenase, partial [Chloroflexi bacterium]|nr:acyl-CoA dehydrogenase [Chloroflexota bacterium]